MEPNQKHLPKILLFGEGLIRSRQMVTLLRDKYNVYTMKNEDCCLKITKERNIDMILLGIDSSKVFNKDCLRLLKYHFPSTLIVIIGRKKSKPHVLELLRSGARDFLEKSIGIKKILKSIDSLISLKSENREIRDKIYFSEIDNSNLSKLIPLKKSHKHATIHNAYFKHPSHPPIPKFISSQYLQNLAKIKRAKEFIESHFSDSFTLSDIANKACMSKYHFCRTFKTIMGVTCKDYLHQIRIDKAKELLKKNELSMADIAYSVGFQSQSHFDHIFKKQTKKSPLELKKSLSLKSFQD